MFHSKSFSLSGVKSYISTVQSAGSMPSLAVGWLSTMLAVPEEGRVVIQSVQPLQPIPVHTALPPLVKTVL